MSELSEQARTFKLGVYQHFKGGKYKTICVGRSSEEREKEFVVYQSLDRGHIWIRPLSMFLEEINRDGYKGSRFTYLSES